MTDPSKTDAGFVVVLGGRSERELGVVRSLGHRVLLVDEQVPWHCMSWADAHLDVDLDDWDAVAEAVRGELGDEPVAAVLTHTEPRLPLMAHLNGRLVAGAPGLDESAVANCRDKWRTRTVLSEAGVPVPRFARVDTADEAAAAAVALGYPVVIKPRDGAGAFGVRCCPDETAVREAVTALLGSPPGALPGVLVEEYVDGDEYAVQTITHGTKTTVLSVFRQRMTPPPVFVELGYDHPSGVTDADHDELARLMQETLAAIGLRDWITHTQVRRGPEGFRVIEVNARRPGGRLVEMTTAVSGVDMTEAVTRQVLGLPQAVAGPTVPFARYTSIVFDTAGTVMYDDYTPAPGRTGPTAPIVEVEVAAGESVHPKEHPNGGVYGRIVVYGETAEELDRAEREVQDGLSLQVVFTDGLGPAAADSREFKSCC
ncbi:acetyl-CoA carboxylase biotin carboxylase subunit family protein [Streptomyces sp. DSM 116496]|uniref:ATP-grasp domain-containing protein n=1 Tax=Streptomyces stoeckheimensis TaxID=3344656 RepID=UPI0038B250EB